MRRAVILGIDGLSPELVKLWLDDLPNLKKMQSKGVWGAVESTVPPASPHAWTCLQCGKNPGVFGFWGSSYRDGFTYSIEKKVDSRVVNERTRCLYRILPNRAQKVAVINVPATWPPPEIPGGFCISHTFNQGKKNDYTWPGSLSGEVKNLVGEYIHDIPDVYKKLGSIDRVRLLKQIYQMDSQRFTLVRYFIQDKKCDYVLAVINGTGLVSDLFYRNFDSRHRFYRSDTTFENAIHEYYKWIDKNIGEVNEVLDDETVLIALSTYSAQKLEGHINLNEWLIKNGYLALKNYPGAPVTINNLDIDWSKTKCWSTGSWGHIYVNLKGREAQGIVEPDRYDRVLDDLRAGLREISDEKGKKLNTGAVKREDIYFGDHVENGPDMFINFDGYKWNTNEMVGYGNGKIHHFDILKEYPVEGHGLYGYYCIAGSDFPSDGELGRVSMLNVAPTVMDIMNLPAPYDMERLSIQAMLKEKEVQSSIKEEDTVRSRLEALGY